MTDATPEPFDQAIAWLRAHEFADAQRLAEGSSVIDGTSLRARVWSSSPSSADVTDLAAATPEGSWPVAILVDDPDDDVIGAATDAAVAVLVLDREHGMRSANERGHDLVEWIGRRQKASSFTARAMHALAAELPDAPAAAPAAAATSSNGLPVRGRDAPVSRNALPTPDVATEPEPTPVEPVDEEAAQLARIEAQREQRRLRKSFKGR